MNPKRLTLARERRGLTKTRLAAAVGLSIRSITAYERGEKEPQEGMVRTIASELAFPVEFFYRDDPAEVEPLSASFRSMSQTTATQRRSAIASAALAVELNRWLEERFDLPTPCVPDLREIGASEAAEALRAEWGLGERPIGNMVHLLESKGVRVFSLVDECREIDGLSRWEGAQPFVFLNTMKSVERSRFDAAHELGHLVLHQHGPPIGQEAEREAQNFASAFLMPYSSFRATAPRIPSFVSILEAKKRWGVSAMAYAYRLREVGLITDWHYYSKICKKLATAGYRSGEPNSTRPRETSLLLSQALSELRGDRISDQRIARDLALEPAELYSLMFGLTLTSLDGGGAGGTRGAAPHLRLVHG
jgi:Zn-dependent peptidase ImmA (M78 family)/DNA-binding XRE family transcriptional regulator